MKQLMLLMTGLLLVVLTACTPMIYGVPQDTWDGMNAEQRTSTIEIYQERQRARQIAAEERARQHAIYVEEKRLQEAAEAEALQLRVEAIYRGEGNYGDLLRVRVENGMANFRGQVRQYDPVAFQIAKGETREVTVATTKNRRVILHAYYDGATLYLDGNRNTTKSRMSKLVYDKRWSSGLTYTDVYTNNKAKLKEADVTVDIVGGKRFGGRHQSSGSNTTIIIKEQPQTIVIKEKPSKVIIYDKSRETTKRQRQQHEKLKKERHAIEKERKALEREQAQFEAEQLALAKERADLEKKRVRIKQMKKEAARDKKQAAKEKQQVTKEKQKAIKEREQTVKELEKVVEEKEKKVAKEEKVVAKNAKKVKEKKQKVKKQEKELKKEEKELEKEIKEEEKEIVQEKKNNGKKK